MTRVGRGVSFEMKGWASPTKTEPSVTPPQDNHQGPGTHRLGGGRFPRGRTTTVFSVEKRGAEQRE